MSSGLAIPGSSVPANALIGSGGAQGIQGLQGSSGAPGDAEVGSVKAWLTASPPAGWMIGDGSAISRTLYPDLFNLIGTSFGSGDGSTTFNLPDLRGRFILPAGQGSGLTNRVLGATGGEETHVLTVAELATHSHNVAVSMLAASGSAVYTPQTYPSSGAYAGQPQGSNTAHNTMPPFLVLTFIVKVSKGGGPTAQAPIANQTQAGLINRVSGNILDYVGGDNACHPLITPTNEYYDQDDFVSATPGAANYFISKLFIIGNSGSSGAVSSLYVTNIPGHPGIIQLAPGTTAGAWARAYMAPMWLDGNCNITIQGVMAIPSGNLVGSNQFYFGLAGSPGPAISTSYSYAGFYGNSTYNNWQAYTRNLAVNAEVIDTGAAANTGAWHKFKVVANLGTVSFYVDDNLITTVTDNSVPTATALMYITFSTAYGSGNYSLFVDCFDIWLQPVVQSGASPTRFMRTIY